MLQAENIDLYYGASRALRQVSLTARPGRITCLLGRNGVGKTSLMRAIFGLSPVANGRIAMNGSDITALPVHERTRKGLALVPQGREIFPRLTVKENLETGLSVLPRNERTIPDEIFALFPVLGDMLHRRGGDLSGGQQQQLAIGRALVTKPKLLVLDEPTEGIQPSIIKQIGRVLSDLARRNGIGVLLVEQYFDFAHELADDIAVMERGEVVLAGEAKSLQVDEVKRLLTV